MYNIIIYILKRISFIILNLIGYCLGLMIYKYLFFEPSSIEVVTESISAVSTSITNPVKFYLHDIDVYKHFYNTVRPDYYYTKIYPLLTETYEDKMIRTALEQYQVVSMNQKLNTLMLQNKIVLGSYLGWYMIMFHIEFAYTHGPLLPIVIASTTLFVTAFPLMGAKLLSLDDDLYMYLIENDLLDRFFFNELLPC
jgi:hypothetical protein